MNKKISFTLMRNLSLTFIFFTFHITLLNTKLCAQIPNTWSQRATFPGAARVSSTEFVIGSKGYVGTGQDTAGNLLNDFWEYDPSTNSWTRLTDFAGIARRGAVGFSIGTKGYLGTGFDGTNNLKDFWEYNPSTGTWTQKRDLGGAVNSNPRRDATSITINDKGYVATGFDGTTFYSKEFWQYDGDTTWIRKADVGIGLQFSYRRWATGFSIDSSGYVGCGYNYSQDWKRDFWRYNLSTNTWTQMANYGGTARGSSVAFVSDGKGYVGTGNDEYYKTDFWQYDPLSNSWMAIANYGGGAISQGISFSLNGSGYVGLGRDSLNYRNDFWIYTPDSTIGIDEQNKKSFEVTVFPNPFHTSAVLKINSSDSRADNFICTLYDVSGNKIREEIIQKNKSTIERKNLSSGIYLYRVKKLSNPNLVFTGKMIID